MTLVAANQIRAARTPELLATFHAIHARLCELADTDLWNAVNVWSRWHDETGVTRVVIDTCERDGVVYYDRDVTAQDVNWLEVALDAEDARTLAEVLIDPLWDMWRLHRPLEPGAVVVDLVTRDVTHD